MHELVVKVIPVNLSMVLLSPVAMALMIIILGGKKRAFFKGLALFLGVATIPALTILASIFIGHEVKTVASGTRNTVSGAIDLVAGGFLTWGAVKFFFDKHYKIKSNKSLSVLGWFGFGLLVQSTDFGQILICFNAAKEVVIAGINVGAKTLFLAFNFLCFMAPLLFPLLYYLLFPKSASKYLPRLNRWTMRNIRMIVVVISGSFGLIFIAKGLLAIF
ncbi:MAG TPA: GAP family protein [Patescibacteria group bacterium]|nr:GAP family protein [Patescibacteria group bacterium]